MQGDNQNSYNHNSGNRHNFYPSSSSTNNNYGEILGNVNQPHHQVHVTIDGGTINNKGCESMCGYKSICRMINKQAVCGCPMGHTGDPSVRCEPLENDPTSANSSNNGCQRHTDCDAKDICLKSVCVDPCADKFQLSHNGQVCGKMAKCLVVEHTPLCGCLDGFSGNPYLECTKM